VNDESVFRRRLFLATAVAALVRLLLVWLEPNVDLAGDEPSWIGLARGGFVKPWKPFAPANRGILFYPPLYPLFLAGATWLTGSLAGAKAVQAVVGSLLVPVVGRLGRLLWSPRVGLVAAVIAALYPDLVWFSVHFWSEALFLVLLWWGFERLISSDVNRSVFVAIQSGVALGLAVLTRDTVLYFVPLAALWPAACGTQPGARRRALGVLLALIVTVAPWTYRNWRLFGAFVPVSTAGSFNLWLGNTSLSRDEVYAQTDRESDPIESDRMAWSQGFHAIRSRQPWWFFEKIRSEMPAFWWGSEALLHVERGAYGATGPLASMAWRAAFNVPWALLASLTILALLARGVRGTWQWFLTGFVAYYVLVHIVTLGAPRFRLPILPVFFLLASTLSHPRSSASQAPASSAL
jgi:4-amino-4-deoxy-L-arabinose transferase-like glycosyltransferase